MQGEATLDDTVLTTGDGAGITCERSVSLTALEDTEILLVDIAFSPPAASSPEPATRSDVAPATSPPSDQLAVG